MNKHGNLYLAFTAYNLQVEASSMKGIDSLRWGKLKWACKCNLEVGQIEIGLQVNIKVDDVGRAREASLYPYIKKGGSSSGSYTFIIHIDSMRISY
jgi:hypothetical protein